METIPRILIIRMSSLGDIILTAPVFRNLRLHWPKAELTLLAKPQFTDAAGKSPFLNTTLAYRGLISAIKAVRKNHYDIVIDLHSNPRSKLISFFSGAKRTICYTKDSLARRLFVNFRVPSPALEKHTLERYLDALSAIGVPVTSSDPSPEDWQLERAAPEIKSGHKRVCLLQNAFLGDSVLTLPLLEKIKNIMPEASLTVLTRPETAPLFSSAGLTAEVLTDMKKSAPFFGEFLRLVQELKKRRFDIAIIPHRSLRSALIARLAGIPVRIGFENSAGKLFLTHKVPFSWLMHDLERNLTLLKPLADYSAPVFPLLNEIADPLKHLNGEKIFIGANPGSVWPTKRWPKEYWAGLLSKLAGQYKTRIMLVGGPNEKEWNTEIEQACAPGSVLNLTGKTGMNELMALIRHMKVFITNDSGPMHIAVAFGVPVTAFFGPTTKELGFFPYGHNNTVLEERLACRPCALHGSKKCPHGHFLCMKLITPDKAFSAVTKLISENTKESK